MWNKLGLKVLAILIAFVMVASSVAMYGHSVTDVEKGISEGGGKGVISLMPLPFIGVASAAEAMDGGESAAPRAATTFLEEEAGISVYPNVGDAIDNKDAVKSIPAEEECNLTRSSRKYATTSDVKMVPTALQWTKQILFIHDGGSGASITNTDWNGYSDLAAMLRAVGFVVTEQNLDPITLDDLAYYDVVVFSPSWHSREIRAPEAEALATYVQNGGGLFLMGEYGVASWSDEWLNSVNKVGRYFGIEFEFAMVCDPTDHYHSKSDPDGGVDLPFITDMRPHKVTDGVSKFMINWGTSLQISASAVAIAYTDSDAWLDINSVWNSESGDWECYQDEFEVVGSFPVLAVSQYESGRVVAIGDRGLFVNAWLDNYDHYDLAQNIFEWLSVKDPEYFGVKAANLAKQVAGAPYLWGGKGWNWNPEGGWEWEGGHFVEPKNGYPSIKGGYYYFNPTIGKVEFGKGLDCSGLSFWTFNKAAGTPEYPPSKPLDYECPVYYEGAHGQWTDKKRLLQLPKDTPTDRLKLGDLLFFDTDKNGRMDHVIMYVGDGDIVHAEGVIYGEILKEKLNTVLERYKDCFGGYGRIRIIPKDKPFIEIVTEKYGYTGGETMSINLMFANPTEEWQPVYFAWRLDLPDYGLQYWIMTKELYLPSDYEQTFTIPFTVGDYGIPFNASWYVALYDTTTSEVISEDTADWKYVPAKERARDGDEVMPEVEEIARKISKTVEKIKFPT